MASVGNQSPWASYRDCSQGICSKYCPQWCYIVFPPPPHLDVSDGDSGTAFSPLIIAVIGILASGLLLVTYYIFMKRYCSRRRHHGNRVLESSNSADEFTNHQAYVAGLDENLIQSITVFKFKKGDGLIEGTECAVCLNEFQENESLRLLTNCTHAFHLPCIDTWLKTHSNCPLCRSTAAPTGPAPPPTAAPPPHPPESSRASSTINVSSNQIHRQSDLVLVVEDCERTSQHEELVVSLVVDGTSKEENNNSNNFCGIDQEGVKHFRRSISLGTFSSRRNLLIADILKIDEEDDTEEQSSVNRDSEPTTRRSPVGMKRSTSSDRFVDRNDRGKNSIFPS